MGILLVVFAAAVLVSLMLLVREVRRVPSRPAPAPGKGEVAPLTDVAPRARRTVPDNPPVVPERARALDDSAAGTPTATAAPAVPPALMPDPANPPQWTRSRAMPGEPTPPDPFTPPDIEQDPDRGRKGKKK
ncbi:MAG: hypothetical protein MJE77_14240 [Proteobacteria bacterium]|nr:hypothetical protein [Pseudomonadota bacterium]